MEHAKPTQWLRLLPIVAIAIVAVSGFVFLGDVLTYELLRDNREALIGFRDANYALTAFLFVAVYFLIVAFSLPGATLATLTGGFLFATMPGVFFNVFAATLGASVIFLAARWGFGERLARRMDASEGKINALKTGIDENQWSMLFLIRLVPIVPFFVANLLPALVGVSLFRFVVSTFLGIIPGGIVYTSVGAGLGTVFERGMVPDLGIIFEPQIFLPLLGLCALAVLPIVLKSVRSNQVAE